MKNKNVTLVCDDTFDGIMTAVYDGWVLMNKGCIVSIHPGKDYSATFFFEIRICSGSQSDENANKSSCVTGY